MEWNEGWGYWGGNGKKNGRKAKRTKEVREVACGDIIRGSILSE
jgi:hypothetical protein